MLLVQVYLGALQSAYEAALGRSGNEQTAALDLFAELGQRVAHAHAGFISGAPASLAHIIQGGIDYALKVQKPLCHFPNYLQAKYLFTSPHLYY